MAFFDRQREEIRRREARISGRVGGKFLAEAGTAALQATAPLTTQTAINIARLGLTGTGVGEALVGAPVASQTANRAATERAIQKLMQSGMSRRKALKRLGLMEPGEIFQTSGSLGSLKGALSGMDIEGPRDEDAGFDLLSPGSLSTRSLEAPPLPGLLGPAPMRIR